MGGVLMAKKVSDEKLLQVLLECGSVTAAADACGLTRNAVFKRLQNPAFRARHNELQGIVLGSAAAELAAGSLEAVQALRDVMRDRDASRGIKVQAAGLILTHCTKYIETANILERLDALERAQTETEVET
jgi:hypothetical protein